VRSSLHLTPSQGIADDLCRSGVDPHRIVLLPNACGLSRDAARRRVTSASDRQRPVLAMGLHRRSGIDLALSAWRKDATLPDLIVAGRDQGSVRFAAWSRAIEDDPRLAGRVHLLGPCWGRRREELLERVGLWLTLYPEDDVTRRSLCPLQVVDAVGSGLPVVATDLPSTRFAVGDGLVTFVAPDDVDSLVEGIHRSLAGPRPSEQQVVGRPRWEDRAHRLVELVGERLEGKLP